MANSIRSAPRRIDYTSAALQDLPLHVDPPPQDSISWKLWTSCTDVAEEAFNTDYIQGIWLSSLNPGDYGHYTIQDCAYCCHAQGDFETIEERSSAKGFPQLAAFAKTKYEGYVAYTKELMEAWHLSNTDAISPSDAAAQYMAFEGSVAKEMDPIYGVIAMIPCEQLWSWLANVMDETPVAGNLYQFWIDENKSWDGAYRLDNFIDGWIKDHPNSYDPKLGLHAYRGSMIGEANFFRSAAGQSLLPMPEFPIPG